MCTKSKQRCFVSYAAEDEALVERTLGFDRGSIKVRSRGLKPDWLQMDSLSETEWYFAPESMRPGDDIELALKQKLQECTQFHFFLVPQHVRQIGQ